jgi:acetyltransferase-like isoleucine patch superfamily enzyme
MHIDINDLTGTWDYNTLPPNVKLGDGCFLERRASFQRYRSVRPVGLVLGAGVAAYTWTEFNIGPEGKVSIGDRCVLVGAVLMCSQRIKIGNDVVISYHVTIADSDFHPVALDARRADAIANAPGGDCSNRPQVKSRSVIIEDGAWIGIGAIILKGVRIGRAAKVMAGSVVTRDVPAGAMVAGNPARVVVEAAW